MVGGRVTIGSGAIAHMQVVVNCETLQIVCQFCGGAALLDAGDVVAAVSEHIVSSDCVRRSVYQLSATVVFVAVCMNVVKSVEFYCNSSLVQTCTKLFSIYNLKFGGLSPQAIVTLRLCSLSFVIQF